MRRLVFVYLWGMASLENGELTVMELRALFVAVLEFVLNSSVYFQVQA